jgi:hypothetical protein
MELTHCKLSCILDREATALESGASGHQVAHSGWFLFSSIKRHLFIFSGFILHC